MFNRAERTPEAVAVSQGIRSSARAAPQKVALAPCQTNFVSSPLSRHRPLEPFSVILDSVAKRSEDENEGFQKACPGGFITGSCDNGHRYAKELYCGREWCRVCNGPWVKSEDMKPSHARRFARWYEKAQQIESMGYWTFTIPEELRWKFRTKEALTRHGHQVQELLKSYGYSRGLRRWHWFGDRSEKWNPHLNVLVDGGLLGGKELRAIRRAYSALLGVKLAIAEYHYLTSSGQKVHALKYVTRATFLDARWDVPMAFELYGFRNQLWWGSGRWDGPAVWSLDDLPGESAVAAGDIRAVACLERGECPRCGLPIHWERYSPMRYMAEMGGHAAGGGYWELPEVPPPARLYTEAELSWVSPSAEGLSRSLGGSWMPVELVRARLEEFSRQHRRFLAGWLWSRESLSLVERELVGSKGRVGTGRGFPGLCEWPFSCPDTTGPKL